MEVHDGDTITLLDADNRQQKIRLDGIDAPGAGATVDAGLEQVRAGMAWFFRRYAKGLPPDRRQQYADMEAQAKAEQRGLWADAEQVPPWDWRAATEP